MTELPHELTAIQTISYLNISHNAFSSDQNASTLWRILADFRNLKELSLSDNYLKGIHTEKLEAGDFDVLEQLDFRNNQVDDQLKLICARNFPSLKQMFITGNPFVNYDADYLADEVQNRVGGELVNETVSYKLRKNTLRKRPIPIVFENIVVIKEDDFKKKVNTEFFGVDIPLNLLKEKAAKKAAKKAEEDGEEEEDQGGKDGFFMTGVSIFYQKKNFFLLIFIHKTLFLVNLETVLRFLSYRRND